MAYTIRQYTTKSGKRYEVRYRKPDGTPPVTPERPSGTCPRIPFRRSATVYSTSPSGKTNRSRAHTRKRSSHSIIAHQ